MKANANISIQVLPMVQDYVPIIDKAIELIAASGVKYVVGPMETTMEGDLDRLMEIALAVQKLCIQEGAGEVVSVIKSIYSPQGVLSIEEKTDKYQ